MGDQELAHVLATHPAFARHGLIGTPGFAPPELARPVWTEMTDASCAELKAKGITVRGTLGRSNVVVHDEGVTYPRVNVNCYGGHGNLVVLGSGELELVVHLKCQDAVLVLGNSKLQSRFDVRLHGRQCGLFIGPRGSSNGTKFHVQGDGSAILVGEDHMFSWDIEVRNHDGHGIFDYDTERVLNGARNVVIEPHVWIGFGVTVSKGVRIGAGSIVGAKSVLTRSVARRTAFAGNPAELRRLGISWTRHESSPPDQVKAAKLLLDHYPPEREDG